MVCLELEMVMRFVAMEIVNKHAKNGMHKEEKMRKNNPRFHHLLFLVLDGLF